MLEDLLILDYMIFVCVSSQVIDTEHRGMVEQCFTALLTEWLQGDPQMKDLLDSLRGPVVDRADLADDLESKIKVGELEWK